jgi:membrane protein YqaA with SNARE-associated domain
MFRSLYNNVLILAERPLALRFLMGLSFIEAFCFPIPPDVMLAPMVMAKPHKAWHFALVTTICSVLGGIIGYCLGYWASEIIVEPLFGFLGKREAYHQALIWFQLWGPLVMLIPAFIPIPYKIFTIGAGAMQMNFVLFVLLSLVVRSIRFFLVCGIFKLGNKHFADLIPRWINVAGWSSLILAVILCGFVFYY